MSDGKLTLLIIALLVFGRSPFTEMAALPSDELVVAAQVAARYNFLGFAAGMFVWWFTHKGEHKVFRRCLFVVGVGALIQGVFDVYDIYQGAPWGELYPASAGLSLGLGLVLFLWFLKYRFSRPFVEFYQRFLKK